MTALLVAENLVKHYRVRRPGASFGARAVLKAVDGVSLSVGRGRTLGIVGESGSGKSTLGRLLLGMEAPSAGRVSFDGAPVEARQTGRWRKDRKRMQMIFQDALGALDRRLRIGEQIAEPLEIHALGDAAGRARKVAETLDAVGLGPQLAERYPHELSGGQRQRAVIARALVIEPDLIVCDEPISALDVSIQAQVVNLLAELQRRLGVAYVFISHDLKVVHHVADEIGVMYLGRIVEYGARERLFRAPAHPYTQALIAAVPRVDPGAPKEARLLAGDPPSPFAVPAGCRFHTRCPIARDICRTADPALAPLPGSHAVACHFPQAARADGKAA
jgi:peptide/nickel transport system ATP-binding protein